MVLGVAEHITGLGVAMMRGVLYQSVLRSKKRVRCSFIKPRYLFFPLSPVLLSVSPL